jgi:hypothetical protein
MALAKFLKRSFSDTPKASGRGGIIFCRGMTTFSVDRKGSGVNGKQGGLAVNLESIAYVEWCDQVYQCPDERLRSCQVFVHYEFARIGAEERMPQVRPQR